MLLADFTSIFRSGAAGVTISVDFGGSENWFCIFWLQEAKFEKKKFPQMTAAPMRNDPWFFFFEGKN